jgi:uncharacterized protein YcbX
MLLRILPDGKLQSIHASSPLETALFSTALLNNNKTIAVSYHIPTPSLAPAHPAQNTTLELPLEPDWRGLGLEQVAIEFNSSGTKCYKMGQKYDDWFTACFGFDVILVFLGDGARPVLGSMDPKSRAVDTDKSQPGWLGGLNGLIPGREQPKAKTSIAFADTGALLIVNAASFEDLHGRLDGDTKAEMAKFRPNIVVSSEDEPAWAEDFWGEIIIFPSTSENSGNNPITIALTANCGRCLSINVDYSTGKESKGPDGQLLKKMMRDRRVDKGVKYNPVFGRYAIPLEEGRVMVGDDVVVSRRNKEQNIFGMWILTWSLFSELLSKTPRF